VEVEQREATKQEGLMVNDVTQLLINKGNLKQMIDRNLRLASSKEG